MQINNIQTLFVGIDPHKQTHTFTALTPFGQRVGTFTFDNAIPGFQKALKQITQLASNHHLTPLISVEDTGGNGESCARYFSEKGFSIKTVNPVLLRREARKNTHPEKSDSQDAEEVARVSLTRSDRLPDFIVSGNRDFAKDLNLLVRDRETLVWEQTKLKNKLHVALQAAWGNMYKTVYQRDIFGVRALKFWSQFPAAVDFKRSTSTTYQKPEALKNCLAADLPPSSEILRGHISRHVKRLHVIRQQLKEITSLLEELVNVKAAYFTSLRGCGSVTAAKLIAELNDINRFENHSKLARYAGIAPRKYESGMRRKDIQSKRGNVRLRQAIKTIALTQIGRNGDQRAKAYYRKKLKDGKTKKHALRCLMRQLTKIIFQMAIEQRPYY